MTLDDLMTKYRGGATSNEDALKNLAAGLSGEYAGPLDPSILEASLKAQGATQKPTYSFFDAAGNPAAAPSYYADLLKSTPGWDTPKYSSTDTAAADKAARQHLGFLQSFFESPSAKAANIGQQLNLLSVKRNEITPGASQDIYSDPIFGDIYSNIADYRDQRDQGKGGFGSALAGIGNLGLRAGAGFALGGPVGALAAGASGFGSDQTPLTLQGGLMQGAKGALAGAGAKGAGSLATLARMAPSDSGNDARGSNMGFFDNLGNGLLGAGAGYLTGGGGGALSGALSGFRSGNGLNLGGLLQTGLGGLLAGRGRILGSRPSIPGDSDNPYMTNFMPNEGAPSPSGGGFNLGNFLSGIGGKIGGLFGRGGSSDGGTPDPNGNGGFLSGLGGILGGLGRGVGGAIGGIRGVLGSPSATGTGNTGQDLSTLAGLGLLGAGLSSDGGNVKLDDIFNGAREQTTGMIDAQSAAEKARRQEAEDQYLGRRASAQQNLEGILGQGTSDVMNRAVQTQEQKLNAQGLLNGPSGALNESIAREAGNVRRSQLPSLIDFASQTETGLNGLRGSGLEGDIGLGRAGLERQFGLTDQTRAATLRQRLLDAERSSSRRKALLSLGGAAVGYGLGGAGGATAGAGAGKTLNDIFGG